MNEKYLYENIDNKKVKELIDRIPNDIKKNCKLKEFEKGKIFLPQLILSAGVATACFDVIKNKMMKEDNAPAAKGNIVLATVKGDIHDIGKNIVKVLLENYGYNVIDLGKDVDYQKVVDAAIEYKAELVGLSALMTTTLVSMEESCCVKIMFRQRLLWAERY